MFSPPTAQDVLYWNGASLLKQAGSQAAFLSMSLGKAKKQAWWVPLEIAASLQLNKQGLQREAYHQHTYLYILGWEKGQRS